MNKPRFVTLGYSKDHPFSYWKCDIKKDFPNYIVLDVYFGSVPDEIVIGKDNYAEPQYIFGWLER